MLKNIAIAEITDCVKAVAAGRDYISPALSGFLINRDRRAATLTRQKTVLDQATPTERRARRLIAEVCIWHLPLFTLKRR